MPLQKGNTIEALQANIGELVSAGVQFLRAADIAVRSAAGTDRAAGIMYRAGGSVLLLLRAPTAGDYPMTWCFPGGTIDDGETPEQAAIRESAEEIGHTPTDALRVVDWSDGFTTFAVDVPEQFVPVLNREHLGYAWVPLASLPQPMHPGCAATLASCPDTAPAVAMDERAVDSNGWFEVKANPISKAGIFPYSGRSMGLDGLDADRIFRVLRKPEALSDQACIDSFKLLPWINDHVMLGPVQQERNASAVAAEAKGVGGVIGQDVFFKDGTLYGNIKAFSSTLAALIAAGKRQLSAGFSCLYDIGSGVWEGQQYDAIQHTIRGNHLALVKEGRMGPDVAVMDHFTFSFDAMEATMAADENKPGAGEQPGAGAMTLDQVVKMVSELAPQVAKLTEAFAALTPVAAAADTEVKKPAMGEGGEGTPEGAVAMDAKVNELTKQMATMRAAMDGGERAMLQQIAKRDALVKQLSAHVGTFDHSEKTYADVVAYGCEKLGIKADAGQEAAALGGYLQAKPVVLPASTVAMDSAAVAPNPGSIVSRHLNKAED